MTDQGKKYLADIVRAIQLIEEFVLPISSYEAYVADLKTQSAVERQLAIIGEAVNKFNKLFPDSRLRHSVKIVGFRNRLIHAYDSVDTSIVWTIVRNYLTPLKTEIAEMPGRDKQV